MKLPPVIGFVGKAGVGKDTAANILVDRHGFVHASWADPIRQMVQALLDYTYTPRSWMHERHLKEEKIPGIGFSYRELAQTLGTEWGRSLDSELWIRLFKTRLGATLGARPVVISDVRFPNEVAAIKSMGGSVIKIIRDVPAVREHISEAHADTLEADYVILNNGPLDRLPAALQQALLYLEPK